MATLVLPGFDGCSGTRGSAGTSLRSWLNDGWALLFSHPDDFVRCDTEQDRWLAIAQRLFAQHRVRPLALARPAQPLDAGWVTQVTGDPALVLLEDPSEFFGRHVRRLREGIQAAGSRFVTVVDSMLMRGKTYSYCDPNQLPSPLDFLAWTRGAREERTHASRTAGSRLAWEEHAPAANRPPATPRYVTA